MGQGEELKTRSDPKVEIQERGEIFFFYRPKVDKEGVHSADDVQRLYLVLHPESGERAVEEKQAPDSGKEGLGFVLEPKWALASPYSNGHGLHPHLLLHVRALCSNPDGPRLHVRSPMDMDFTHISLCKFRPLLHAGPPMDMGFTHISLVGCEFLLISASGDIEEELGLELKTEGKPEPSCSDLLKTFGETASATLLLKGNWV
ncbi:hypothetical protein HHK36_013462 [Tetracentron sinense]|uniref:Uncharacterized protein n=1 Tax=Tetracentron sinense TaxID=13715 RepID=A0A834Z782_TETSI|nr:hypothetical protein HHK36_013462 [Tetracentron sinense]